MNKQISKILSLLTVLSFALTFNCMAAEDSAFYFTESITEAFEKEFTNVEANGITLVPNASFATCLNSADGTATVIASGGVEPYTYLWSTGETFVVEAELLPGDYTVTVTDATGCTASTTVTVLVGPEGVWLMPVSTPASCGACDGTADPMAMLGVPPYTLSLIHI